MAIGDGGELKWGSITRMIFIDINNQWRVLSYPSDEITRKNGYSADNGK